MWLVRIRVLVGHLACLNAIPATQARGRPSLAPLLLLNAWDVALVPSQLLLVFRAPYASHVPLARGHRIVLRLV